jgi:hypothetical protein
MFQLIPLANNEFSNKKIIIQIFLFVIIPFAILFFIPDFKIHDKIILQKYIQKHIIMTYHQLTLEILESY